MSRFLLMVILPIILSLGACASTGLKVTGTQEISVALPIRCVMPVVTPPNLVFDTTAKVTMSLFDKTKLLLIQDENLKIYSSELVAALDVCAKAPLPVLPTQSSSSAQGTK